MPHGAQAEAGDRPVTGFGVRSESNDPGEDLELAGEA
jgi:hypothetical protein